jgi:hypothetical protein
MIEIENKHFNYEKNSYWTLQGQFDFMQFLDRPKETW